MNRVLARVTNLAGSTGETAYMEHLAVSTGEIALTQYLSCSQYWRDSYVEYLAILNGGINA